MSLLSRFRATNFNHNATVSMIELTAFCAFLAAVGLATPGACPMDNSAFVFCLALVSVCVLTNIAIAIYAFATRKTLKRMAPRTGAFLGLITAIMMVVSVGAGVLDLNYPQLAYVAVGVWTVSAYIVYFNKPKQTQSNE